MRTFRLRVAYDGTDFHGWQDQPGRRTVQGSLRDAARPLCSGTGKEAEPELIGASRTDAGVHALGQAAHLRLVTGVKVEAMVPALNSRLAPDVRVVDARETGPEFNARFDAVQKWYRYRILERAQPSPLERRTSWHVRMPLDLEAARSAAAALIGEHDFASFTAKSRDAEAGSKSTVRSLDRVVVRRAAPVVWFDVLGRSFLYKMVRNLVGTLVEVGEGKREPGDLARILAAADRRQAGRCAPPQGLFLMGVRYAGDREFDLSAPPTLELGLEI